MIPTIEISSLVSESSPAIISALLTAIAVKHNCTLRSFNRSLITGVPRFPACLPYLCVHHKNGIIFEA